MKTPLLVPILLCSLPIAALLSGKKQPDLLRTTGDPVTYQGSIEGWSVSSNGTVAVRLAGTHDGKEFSLWFATPPNQNSTTHFENLVLEAALAVSGPKKGASITVVSDGSADASGKSAKEALTLASIAQL